MQSIVERLLILLRASANAPSLLDIARLDQTKIRDLGGHRTRVKVWVGGFGLFFRDSWEQKYGTLEVRSARAIWQSNFGMIVGPVGGSRNAFLIRKLFT